MYINEIPVAYTELYASTDDSLSKYYDAQKSDYGWHLLVGEPWLMGSGLSLAIGHCIVSFIFEHTSAETVVCEPDHRNQRMISFVKKLAHTEEGLLSMKTQKAQLMRCEKSDFLALPILSLAVESAAMKKIPL